MCAMCKQEPVAPQALPMPDKHGRLAALLFLIGVPLACHVLFSWMGFSPTDEGFTLAYSRRILNGEVPHRDFIIIRPCLSPLIHVPIVALGGDYTLMLSRLFAWFEVACTAWIWVCIAGKLLPARLSSFHGFSLALTAFAFSAHGFPIMAWHTIDALLLVSVGLLLCLRRTTTSFFVGVALVGAAYLCKQSFALMVPVALVLLGGWRRPMPWFAGALPGVIYLAYLAATRSLGDAAVQLTAQTGLLGPGLVRYLESVPFFVAVVVGYLRMGCNRSLGRVCVVLVAAYACFALATDRFMLRGAFAIFGLLVGIAVHLARDRGRPDHLAFVTLGLATAWSASISVGYRSPALGVAPLVVAMLALGLLDTSDSPRIGIARKLHMGFALLALVCFVSVRCNHVYRDGPASALTSPLAGVLPGAAGIKTNPTTRAYLRDLCSITAQIGDKPYCVMPDSAAYWVKADRPNPLPIDWPSTVELSNPRLLRRVLRALDGDESLTVVVQKYDVGELALDLAPLGPNDVVDYVQTHFTKQRETRYFKIYTARR